MKSLILFVFVFSILCLSSCGDFKENRVEFAKEAIHEYFNSFNDTTYILDSLAIKNIVEFDDENYKESLIQLGSFFCNVGNTKIDSLLNVKPSCSKYYIAYIYCIFNVDDEIHVSDSLPMLLDENYNIIEYI